MGDLMRRFSVLEKAYYREELANAEYLKFKREVQILEEKLNVVTSINRMVETTAASVTSAEKKWHSLVLGTLECELKRYLSIVYPEDEYEVHLDCDIKHKKIKLTPSVSSKNFLDVDIDGQGRLFKQIVTIVSVAVLMRLRGVHTLYVDEAFSGASKSNLQFVGRVIDTLNRDGFNMVLILQNIDAVPENIKLHEIFLSRSQFNCTTIDEKDYEEVF